LEGSSAALPDRPFDTTRQGVAARFRVLAEIAHFPETPLVERAFADWLSVSAARLGLAW
jgi:hypothetical protein